MLTREQFVELAMQFQDMIFRLAFSCLKSAADADDVTQEVLLRLYQSDRTFESNEHIRYWLVRVTINECKKLWRSPWRKAEDLESYANTLSFESQKDSDLFCTIMEMDRKYRTVLLLYYYEGYSITEVSELLHIPAGTVGTRLRRARNILKNALTEAEP